MSMRRSDIPPPEHGLHQRDAFNASRDKFSYPPIPDAQEFLHRYSYEKPVAVHGWQWTTTFNRWSALVTFADGWHGFTYPRNT